MNPLITNTLKISELLKHNAPSLSLFFLNRTLHVDNMELQRSGLKEEEEDEEDDDVAAQYVIEQSLLERSKQKETHRDEGR